MKLLSLRKNLIGYTFISPFVVDFWCSPWPGHRIALFLGNGL